MPNPKRKHNALMTTPEVAAIFGCDVRTIHRWTAEGRIQSVTKLPGKTGAWLYDRTHIEQAAADADIVRVPKATA
jgi:predicted site-specific integrase-resolvase